MLPCAVDVGAPVIWNEDLGIGTIGSDNIELKLLISTAHDQSATVPGILVLAQPGDFTLAKPLWQVEGINFFDVAHGNGEA